MAVPCTEHLFLMGRKGVGKSTLLRAVNRMHQITSGTLTVNGTDVSTPVSYTHLTLPTNSRV